jgi:hypothetical protein
MDLAKMATALQANPANKKDHLSQGMTIRGLHGYVVWFCECRIVLSKEVQCDIAHPWIEQFGSSHDYAMHGRSCLG